MTSSNANLKFSQHARIRQGQRNITGSSVSVALQRGEQIDCKDATIYTDQNIKVVFSNDNKTVITVNKNTRNTNFQLSERTKQKQKSLLYKVNVKNNNHAMCELAELYLTGELGEKDIGKAYNLFERAAKMGNSHAMCKVSQLYASGDLGEPNQELADRWMKKAADRNNVYALAVVGQELLVKYQEKYPKGSNIFRPSAKKKEILYYLSKAADKGSTRAIWHLGNVYEEGLLGEQDLSKSIELYVKAAKQGSPASLASLHNMTLKCNFNVKELEEILDNVSSFLTTTSIGMAFQIGQEQLIGNLGYNPIRGLKMIEQAALKQYDQAMLKLAKCYRDGTKCNVNLKLAHYWFMELYKLYDLSAKKGNVISLWKLGKLNLKGNVGNIDLTKAESCFKEAIEKSSDPNWIYELGILYLKGRLGDKPTDIGIQLIGQAIKIWQLQASQGDTRVYFDLGNACLSINAHTNAVYWLSKAPSNNIDSQLCLAKIYLDNSSPEKNISLGLNILKNIVLEHGIDTSNAFEAAKFTINDQTVRWLQDIAEDIKKTIPSKNCNQQAFEQFVITTLAKVYELGQLGEIDYNLAAKYYYQLFITFESITTGNKLVWLYSNQHLPAEYYDAAKNWVLQIPALLETNKIDFDDFIDCVLLLGKIHQKDSIMCDVKEATKWLYLASYFHLSDNMPEVQDIKHDLAKLPQLDYNKKEQIVSELSKTTQNIKITSPLNYKVLSRILGDIFYDNKIIDQNIDQAIYWYTESALTNNGLASFALGKIYHSKEEIDTSIRWYMLSAQQGNKDALKKLTDIFNEQNFESLSQFLNRYQHQSLIAESKIINVNSLMNLEFYPQTTQEMYVLGKHYLNPENKQYVNAAFWFRRAMKHGSIDAAIELHSMYKSGILGSNVIQVADNVYLDILEICYSKLKTAKLLLKQNTSSILTLLNNVSSVLKTGNITFSCTLNQKIEKILNQTHNIDTATLTDVISDLELLKLELCSNNLECTISNALDNISLSEKETPSISLV